MSSSLRSRRRRTATAGPSRTLSTTPSARAMDLQLSRCSFQRCAIQLHLSPAAASPRVQIDANHVLPISRCFSRGRDRFGFRLCHFSVQGNHLHLVVEADDEKALARGMQGLGVRIAKALNRVMGLRGTVFADHYYARILRSPTQVANALAYVLMNFPHHFPGEASRYTEEPRDRFSSTWREGVDPPVLPASTWLLSVGWRTRASATLLALAGLNSKRYKDNHEMDLVRGRTAHFAAVLRPQQMARNHESDFHRCL